MPDGPPVPLRYLSFELSEGDDGVSTLDAMASTGPDEQAAVLAEAQQVLDWAWRHFPHSHGPVDEGGDWDHHLHTAVEDGRWHVVALTLGATRRFVDAFFAALSYSADGQARLQ